MTPGICQTKWLDALESDEYKQIQGQLEAEGGFCCLGVAKRVCDLREDDDITLRHSYAILGLYGKDGQTSGDRVLFEQAKVVINKVFNPEWVAYWDGALNLTSLNDTARLSFAQIASLIRQFPALWLKESR